MPAVRTVEQRALDYGNDPMVGQFCHLSNDGCSCDCCLWLFDYFRCYCSNRGQECRQSKNFWRLRVMSEMLAVSEIVREHRQCLWDVSEVENNLRHLHWYDGDHLANCIHEMVAASMLVEDSAIQLKFLNRPDSTVAVDLCTTFWFDFLFRFEFLINKFTICCIFLFKNVSFLIAQNNVSILSIAAHFVFINFALWFLHFFNIFFTIFCLSRKTPKMKFSKSFHLIFTVHK